MFHIVLFEPEIPPNTGNIMRLAANTGAPLHLIHPLGFDLDEAKLRRAGLDYRSWARVAEHADFAAFSRALRPARLFACSTRGKRDYTSIDYAPGDALLFGPETRGLPASILSHDDVAEAVRIPMVAASRSLNLSNAVAVVVFEAWRQNGFAGAAG